MYFRVGAGGAEYKIYVTTSDTSLYGVTLTISKNGTTVGTTTFDNQGEAEYTVDEAGLYTVSVTLGGTTFTDTVEVTDTFDATIEATPDGSTVLPVNDIQTWLHCGNVWDKNYTTLSEVLADTTTLLALINSNNAVDYMVRSHDWCTDVCADATAMTYIGANDYASDKLLDDSTWLDTICASTYFESVLNTKVPTMTDNTHPSGTCTADNDATNAFKAFDGNASTYWTGKTPYPSYVQYSFTAPVRVVMSHLIKSAAGRLQTYKIQASSDGETWVDLTDSIPISSAANNEKWDIFENSTKYPHIRFNCLTGTPYAAFIYQLQFYGRIDVEV